MLRTVCCLFLAGLLLAWGISQYVLRLGDKGVVSFDSALPAEAILILGARVFENGGLSLMLRDRLDAGLDLYRLGKAGKIIVSGDHGQEEYDEVNAMKDYLLGQGVPAEDVFMDHAGFSTYESIYRAKAIFQARQVIIVTQRFHLARSLFIAGELGLPAQGVAADRHIYSRAMLRSQLREIAARNKDFITARLVRPLPTYLGDTIPLSGDGRQTDDRQE